MTASTFLGPIAFAARNADSAESIPPERPTTTRSKPTLWTSFWMKPVRSRSVERALMASRDETDSSSAAGMGALAIALAEDALVLAHGQLQLFIAQQGKIDAHAAQRCGIQLATHQRFFEVGRLGQALAIGADNLRPAPEVDPILVAHAVAEDDKAGEELGIHAVQHLDGIRTAKRSAAGDNAPARAAVDADQIVGPVCRHDADGRVVPDVLTDEQAAAAEAGIESLDAIALGEVALVGEHTVIGQVHLAVQVLDAAPLDEGARDVVREVGGLFNEADDDRHFVAGGLYELGQLGRIETQTGMVGKLLEEVPG